MERSCRWLIYAKIFKFTSPFISLIQASVSGHNEVEVLIEHPSAKAHIV